LRWKGEKQTEVIWSAKRIGIFDSGVGGISVANAIRRAFSQVGLSFSLFYLGDTENLPYGSKSIQTLRLLARRNVHFFNQLQLDHLVVACNTSHSVAMDIFDEESNCPVVGVIDPAVRSLQSRYSVNPVNIGIIATERTVQSGCYQKKLSAVLPMGSRIYQKACPLLVPLIEGWDVNPSALYTVSKEYLSELIRHDLQTIVFGCTHYPFLLSVMKQSTSIEFFDPAYAVASELVRMMNISSEGKEAQSETQIMVTGNPDQFIRTLKRFQVGWVQEVRKVIVPEEVGSFGVKTG